MLANVQPIRDEERCRAARSGDCIFGVLVDHRDFEQDPAASPADFILSNHAMVRSFGTPKSPLGLPMFNPTPDPNASFRFRPSPGFVNLPVTDGYSGQQMLSQKRKRLSPGLSGFTKVGANDGLNPPGVDPLAALSHSAAQAGFSCETPTMAPIPQPSSSSGVHSAKMYRLSPRLSSSGIFNSPMFSVQTPVFEYQSAPNVFHSAMVAQAGGTSSTSLPFGSQQGGAAPQHQPGLMSPIPFMESPATMYSHELQQHSLTMDNPPGLILAGTQPHSSVLDRFKKFFDNQKMPADFNSPSIPSATQPINDSFSLAGGLPPLQRHHAELQASSLHKSEPKPAAAALSSQWVSAADDDEISSIESREILSLCCFVSLLVADGGDAGPSANPELNDSVFRSGSSCHQCKSRRMQGYLSFCSGTSLKRKVCRKKYCDACLAKFYQMEPSRNKPARDQSVWSCPSCRGICCCAACRRSKTQQMDASRLSLQQRFSKAPEMYSPATSMAVGLVYFGDFDLLEGSIPPQLPPPPTHMSTRPQQQSMAFAPP